MQLQPIVCVILSSSAIFMKIVKCGADGVFFVGMAVDAMCRLHSHSSVARTLDDEL